MTPQKKITLLGMLDADVREKILAQCELRTFAKGKEIIGEATQENNMYFIKRGRAQVTLFSKDGREVSFVILEEGGSFGEISVIDGKPRSANVVALSATEIYIMPPQVFWRMLRDHPDVGKALLQQLTAIIRRLCDRIFEYSTIGVNNRIHAELLRLAKDNIDLDGTPRIPNMPTHAQFASRVSCHREAVSRELKSLENRGIVEKKNRKFIVKEMKELEKMVEGVHGT